MQVLICLGLLSRPPFALSHYTHTHTKLCLRFSAAACFIYSGMNRLMEPGLLGSASEAVAPLTCGDAASGGKEGAAMGCHIPQAARAYF